MAKKIYEETNIREIGNALRRKLGNTRVDVLTLKGRRHVANADDFYTIKTSGHLDAGGTYVYDAGKPVKWVIVGSAYGADANVAPGWMNKVGGTWPSGGTSFRGKTAHEVVYEDSRYLCAKFYAFANSNTTGTIKVGYYVTIVAFDENGVEVPFVEAYEEEPRYYDVTMPMTVDNTFKTVDMAGAIDSLSSGEGAAATFMSKEFTENGEYNASLDDGVDGYSNVTVNVVPTLVDKPITENGVYYASNDDAYGYRSVEVNVQHVPLLQEKQEFFSQSEHKLVTADEGYDGLRSVDIVVSVSAAADAVGFNMNMDQFTSAYYSYGTMYFYDAENDRTPQYWDISNQTNKPTQTSVYSWYAKSDTQVGDYIWDKLRSHNQSKYNYTCGFYYHGTSTKPTPDTDYNWDNICNTTDQSGAVFYKTCGLEVINADADKLMGDILVINKLGYVIFRGSITEAVNAINNKTIDTRDGFFFMSTEMHTQSSSGKLGTIRIYMRPKSE